MSRIRSKDTKPEVLVRSLLHSLGYRFRKNVKTLPGKPDVVLKKHNAVIFVHGCFWHQHKGCRRSNMPKSNLDYWKPKLERNSERDKQHIKDLKKLGWKVLTIWECEVQNEDEVEKKLTKFLKS